MPGLGVLAPDATAEQVSAEHASSGADMLAVTILGVREVRGITTGLEADTMLLLGESTNAGGVCTVELTAAPLLETTELHASARISRLFNPRAALPWESSAEDWSVVLFRE